MRCDKKIKGVEACAIGITAGTEAVIGVAAAETGGLGIAAAAVAGSGKILFDIVSSKDDHFFPGFIPGILLITDIILMNKFIQTLSLALHDLFSYGILTFR